MQPEGECYPGRCVFSTLPNGHKIKILYKNSQLEEAIYPNLSRTLQEGGFQAEGRDWWNFLKMVATGGTTSLNGPRFPNPKYYKLATMQAEFMRAERTLAHALLTAVFCKEVPYGCSPISFKEASGCFKFDTDTAFRRATHVFRAENESEKDLYRITIEGTGHNLSMHRFSFEPSLTWLCRRYPETFRLTANSGGALGSEQDPPGGGDGGPRPLSAASEPLVRDSNRSLYSFQTQVTCTAVLCRRYSGPVRRSRNSSRKREPLHGSRPKNEPKKAEVNNTIRRRRPRGAAAATASAGPGPTWPDPGRQVGAPCAAPNHKTPLRGIARLFRERAT